MSPQISAVFGVCPTATQIRLRRPAHRNPDSFAAVNPLDLRFCQMPPHSRLVCGAWPAAGLRRHIPVPRWRLLVRRVNEVRAPPSAPLVTNPARTIEGRHGVQPLVTVTWMAVKEPSQRMLRAIPLVRPIVAHVQDRIPVPKTPDERASGIRGRARLGAGNAKQEVGGKESATQICCATNSRPAALRY